MLNLKNHTVWTSYRAKYDTTTAAKSQTNLFQDSKKPLCVISQGFSPLSFVLFRLCRSAFEKSDCVFFSVLFQEFEQFGSFLNRRKPYAFALFVPQLRMRTVIVSHVPRLHFFSHLLVGRKCQMIIKCLLVAPMTALYFPVMTLRSYAYELLSLIHI